MAGSPDDGTDAHEHQSGALSPAEVEAAPEKADGELGGDPLRVGDGRMVEAVRQTLSEHEGPLPSQEWFAAVESLAPGATADLVADYIAERGHQRDIQRAAVDIDRDNFRRFARYQTYQLLAAWTVVIVLAAGGIALIALGHSIAGLVYLVSELAILAGVFLGRQLIHRQAPGSLEAQREDQPPAEQA